MGGGNSSSGLRWALVAVAVAIPLGGCAGEADEGAGNASDEPNIVQAGAPGEQSRPVSKDELERLEETPHTQADVNFMLGMIHHHAQALQMTRLVRKRSASEDIPLLARRTEISQGAEIETMERWLKARGVEPPDAEDHRKHHGPGGGLMPGMVSERELARLAAARGAEFDGLFLDYMTRHHRGALTMVADLTEEGGGLEPEIGVFARHVDSDQNIEIARMRELQADNPKLAAARRAGPSRELRQRAQRLAYRGGSPALCYVG